VFCAVNRSTVTARTFKLRCSESSCRALYAFGEVFYLLPGGGHIAPPIDRTMPPHAIFEADGLDAECEATDAGPVETLPIGTLSEQEYHGPFREPPCRTRSALTVPSLALPFYAYQQ
jgi:hypothetical protein